MVIVEAMAMGRPVLSTPVGIAPEVVETGVTGVLASGTGVEALTEGLHALLALRERWPELGAAARARVAGFTARAMAEEYERLYEGWLG
jgi:glycosyltransferase involved in cell wall biosynthesis